MSNAIQVMLEALKSTRPSRQHCTSNEQWDDAMDFHDQAIALGEAELAREPVAIIHEDSDALYVAVINQPIQDGMKLFTREEIK